MVMFNLVLANKRYKARSGFTLVNFIALGRLFALWLIVIQSALTLTGCATMDEGEAQALPTLVFPPPPDEPRFIFERTILGSTDIEVEDRKTRWRQMLTGEPQVGTGFAKPFDVAVCQGRIYVSDTVRRRVLTFDVPGRHFFQIGEKEPGLLIKPLGLSTDADCNVYVADATMKRIAIYDQEGNFLRALGGLKFFERLSHVTVDPEGTRVFAVDTGGVKSELHRVRVFDAVSGNHLYDIGKRGNGDGEFNLPRDIDIGPDGNLYVVDSGNFRVEIFKQDGSFVGKFGEIGRRSGQFGRPKGIGVDNNGNVYVSDASFGNFQIFDPNGRLLLFIGSRSTNFERAKYMLPAGLDVDEDGRVYMVDQYFQKLDIYRPANLNESEGYLASNRSDAKK